MPSTMKPTVRPVLTRGDRTAFIKFPWKIYDGNPYWVPPLLSDRKKLIDTKKNPFYRHAQLQLLLAERDGAIVGRIGAIVNDNHIKEHNEKVGFFGFFECIDDQSVADALFDAAADWLRERGMEAMRGPASPSVNDEYGLLVDGFDKSPAILMPYNPAYYARLIEGHGFTKAKDLYSYALRSDLVFTEKFTRVSEMFKKRAGVVFRSLNMRDFKNEVDRIREMYNRGWARNWGAVPMTKEEFEYAAKDLKPIANPELIIIAEVKGKPVGFGMSLPDLNIVLKDNKRGYLIPALVRLVLFKKRINRTRIVILGVLPEYRNSGIGGVLFYETGVRSVKNGMHRGEAGWVNDDNLMMIRGAEMMNGERYKTYRLYQRPL